MCHYLFSLITFPVALPAPPSLITSLVWSMLNMAELGKALPPRLSAGIHYSPRSSHCALSAGPGATLRSPHRNLCCRGDARRPLRFPLPRPVPARGRRAAPPSRAHSAMATRSPPCGDGPRSCAPAGSRRSGAATPRAGAALGLATRGGGGGGGKARLCPSAPGPGRCAG